MSSLQKAEGRVKQILLESVEGKSDLLLSWGRGRRDIRAGRWKLRGRHKLLRCLSMNNVLPPIPSIITSINCTAHMHAYAGTCAPPPPARAHTHTHFLYPFWLIGYMIKMLWTVSLASLSVNFQQHLNWIDSLHRSVRICQLRNQNSQLQSPSLYTTSYPQWTLEAIVFPLFRLKSWYVLVWAFTFLL